MGYQTDFEGEFKVEPPLSAAEVAYLKMFAGTRHCEHQPGPYAADGTGNCPGSGTCAGETPGLPEIWCKWEPDGDGAAISWNGMEKFYCADLWVAWLIRHLLGPEAAGHLGHAERRAPELRLFACDHVLNGAVDAQGQDPADRWQLIVRDNEVTRRDAKPLEFEDEVPV